MEVLITLTILSIVSPLLYGTLNMGQKTYMKQKTEVQFREDADYISTMIMNEFYSTPFDYLKSCGADCLTLVDAKELGFTEVETEDTTYYDVEPQAKTEEETTISLKDGAVMIDGSPLEVSTTLTGSTIDFSCAQTDADTSECTGGIIQLNLELSSSDTSQSLQLESEFGF